MESMKEGFVLQNHALLHLPERPVWVHDGMSGEAFQRDTYDRVRVSADKRK